MSEQLWVFPHFLSFLWKNEAKTTRKMKMKMRRFLVCLSSARHPCLSCAAFHACPLSVRCQSFQDGERYPAGWRLSQTQIPSAVRSHFRWLEGGEENWRINPPCRRAPSQIIIRPPWLRPPRDTAVGSTMPQIAFPLV